MATVIDIVISGNAACTYQSINFFSFVVHLARCYTLLMIKLTIRHRLKWLSPVAVIQYQTLSNHLNVIKYFFPFLFSLCQNLQIIWSPSYITIMLVFPVSQTMFRCYHVLIQTKFLQFLAKYTTVEMLQMHDRPGRRFKIFMIFSKEKEFSFVWKMLL